MGKLFFYNSFRAAICAVFIFINAINIYGVRVGRLDYLLNEVEKTAKVNSYIGDIPQRLEIPTYVTYEDNTYIVNEIADSAFFSAALDVIILPNTIQKIGESSFAYSTLTTIELPSSLETIFPRAFECCNIKELAFSDYNNSSLKVIGDGAFSHCGNLVHMPIPNLVDSIGVQAFHKSGIREFVINDNPYYSTFNCSLYNKDATKLIWTNTPTILPTVQIIGSYAFSSVYFSEIALPESVRVIEEGAFLGTDITTISLPSRLDLIGSLAFAYCSKLRHIFSFAQNPPEIQDDTFRDIDKDYVDIYVKTGAQKKYQDDAKWKEFFYIEELTNIINYEYDQLNATASVSGVNINHPLYFGAVGSLEVPEKIEKDGKTYIVNSINDYAFHGNRFLTSIVLPKSIVYIKSHAFAACTALSQVNIPNSVISIGEISFSNTLLHDIVIPESVQSIGDYAFNGNEFLENIVISEGTLNYGDEVFSNSPNIKVVEYKGTSVVEGPSNMFDRSVYDSAVLQISSKVTDIIKNSTPWGLFSHIKSLTDSHIDDVTVASYSLGIQEVYNLRGIKMTDNLDSLPSGIYIIREGTRFEKIVIQK